jgi:hypothetical protein
LIELTLYLFLLKYSWQEEFFPGIQYLPTPEKEEQIVPIPPAQFISPESAIKRA